MNSTIGKILFITTLLSTTVVKAQKYRIETTNLPNEFEVVNIKVPSIRYPCRGLPPPFSVLECTKEDGITILMDSIVGYSGQEERRTLRTAAVQPGNSNRPIHRATAPCRTTPNNFDGPGGVSCPPDEDRSRGHSTLTTTTSVPESSNESKLTLVIDPSPAQKQRRTPLMIVVAIVLGVVGVSLVIFSLQSCMSIDNKTENKEISGAGADEEGERTVVGSETYGSDLKTSQEDV